MIVNEMIVNEMIASQFNLIGVRVVVWAKLSNISSCER